MEETSDFATDEEAEEMKREIIKERKDLEMVSLVDLLLPNLAETGLGLIYIIVAVVLFFIGLYVRFLDRVINIVALVFLLLGLFTIFGISLINDISANRNLTLGLSGLALVGVVYYLLFKEKKKRGKR